MRARSTAVSKGSNHCWCHVELSSKAHSLVFVHQLLVVQISQSSSQHAVDAGLGSKAVANHHETMAHQHHLVQLVSFLHEDWGGLQVGCLACCPQAIIQVLVIWLWKRHLMQIQGLKLAIALSLIRHGILSAESVAEFVRKYVTKLCG